MNKLNFFLISLMTVIFSLLVISCSDDNDEDAQDEDTHPTGPGENGTQNGENGQDTGTQGGENGQEDTQNVDNEQDSTQNGQNETEAQDLFSIYDCDSTNPISCDYFICFNELSYNSIIHECSDPASLDCTQILACYNDYINCATKSCPAGSSLGDPEVNTNGISICSDNLTSCLD